MAEHGHAGQQGNAQDALFTEDGEPIKFCLHKGSIKLPGAREAVTKKILVRRIHS